jgi:teichuronic acid biosynthesis glycosyltransferase TuaC
VRIVVVTTSFPRFRDDPSGHFVLADAVARARAGHEVHVIAPGGSRHDRPRARRDAEQPSVASAASVGTVTVHRAGGGGLFRWPGALARLREEPLRLVEVASFSLGVRARLAEVERVDAVVAHFLVPSAFPLLTSRVLAASLPAPVRDALARAPLEARAHGADVRLLLAMPRALRLHALERLLAPPREVSVVFASSAQARALHAAAGPLAARLERLCRVEPPALDVPDVSARARALRGGVPGTLLVAVGRLVPDKRYELALEAVAALGLVARGGHEQGHEGQGRAPGRAVTLALLGDGPERAALEARARALGLDVRFVGAVPRREALAWIAAADVLLHPSRHEAAPSVVREARAYGTGVVACDAGDVAAWALGDRGIAVASAEPVAFAAAIRAMLRRGAT